MSPTYVEPRDFRLGEFISSSDCNALLGDDVMRLYQGIAARCSAPGGQVIPNRSDTKVDITHEFFDRGLHDPGQSDGLTLNDEGAWLTGMQLSFPPSSTAGFLGYLKRLRGGQGQGQFISTFDGLNGSHYATKDTRISTVAPLYGFPGDLIEAWTYTAVDTGGGIAIDDGNYAQPVSPVLWGLQLTGGRTKETWTPPKRTASSPWLTTDIPTDAQMNQLRDDLRWLRSRPVAIVAASWASTVGNVGSTFVTNNILNRPIADAYGMFAPANTDRVTIPTTGVYLIIGLWGFDYNATGYRSARLRLNSATNGATNIGGAFTGNPGNARGFVLAARGFTAGDYIQLQQAAGVTVGSRSRPYYGYPLLCAIHISDTATPPAWTPPPVYNRLDAAWTAATLNAFGDRLQYLYGPPCVIGQRTADLALVGGQWKSIPFSAADLVNNVGSTWHNGGIPYTVQQDGVYLLFGQVQFAFVGKNGYFVRVQQNGVQVVEIGPYAGINSGSQSTVIPFITCVRAKAGDVFNVDALAKTATNVTSTSGTGGTWFGLVQKAA